MNSSKISLSAFCGAILLLCTAPSASDVFFREPFTLWESPEILVWTPDSTAPIDPKEFSLSLKRNNGGIGNPTTRLAGEWERDTSSALYANWLRENLEPGLSPELLKARDKSVAKKISEIEDRYLLFVTRKSDKLYVALFNEESSAPKVAGTLPYNDDKIQLGDDLAEMLFGGSTERRLTKEERKKQATEPNPYYSEIPKFHGWAGVAIGYTQAKIPFTPDSWYNHKLKSRIKNYRNTEDSLSVWNFLDDKSPLFTVYAGGTWYGFIGAEIFLRYSSHDAKIDERDTIYNELDHWTFNRYEIGLNLMLSRTYAFNKYIDISPYAYLGFIYSFFSEDIDTKSGVEEPSGAYKTRIEFQNFYKGAIMGIGTRGIFLKHYGLDLRAGIAGRGRSLDREPSADAVAEPTQIGGSTIDCFISLGLEYHWDLK